MKHGLGQVAAMLSFPPPGEKPCFAALASSPRDAPVTPVKDAPVKEVPPAPADASVQKEALEGHVALGIEALRRENEKFLEAEVAKWNALTPHESPFEWKGKSAAEILSWRNAKLGQVLGENAQSPHCLQSLNGPRRLPMALQKTDAPPPQEALANAALAPPCPASASALACACEETPGPPCSCEASPADTSSVEATEALVARHHKTKYEEKLARWKRAILEEKIIDLDDAAFEEKFAEWDTHALRLEAIKQEILRLERKAVELKIEELREQAAKQQAELKAAQQKGAAEKF